MHTPWGFSFTRSEEDSLPTLAQLASLLQQIITLIRAEDVAPHSVHQLLLRDEEVLLVLGAPVGKGGAHAVERHVVTPARVLNRIERGPLVNGRSPTPLEKVVPTGIEPVDQAK